MRKCTNHFRNMNSEVKLMICVDQNGQAVEISVADQMWLDDAYFKEKQLRLGTDAPRAALAYRVSTKGQVDHDDIPMQKIDCRKFAQKQGWRVVKEVAEKGVSGSKVSASKRDAIQQLKEEAANGEFDILLVYMFDRLGRIESETPFVLEWFVQHGIEMWSTHEGQQKIETHGDKLMNYIRFWQAAGESEKTSIRTRDRIRQIVSSGHYTGGFVCYGYQLVDQGRRNKRDKPVMDLVINEEEATWVRELFYKVIQEGTSGYAEQNSNRVTYSALSATRDIQVTSLRKMPARNTYRNCRSLTKKHSKKPMTLSADAAQRQRKTGESPIPARTRRCWRVLSTAPTAERRCPALCTQTATNWRMVVSAKKSSPSITAFSAANATKAAETVMGKHCTLPREWMPSS